MRGAVHRDVHMGNDGKLAQPLTGCCIKGNDLPDDPAEQFAVCE